MSTRRPEKFSILITITEDEKERFRKLSEEKRQLDIQSWEADLMHKGEQKIINLLKSGKSPEEILKDYGENP